MIFSCPLRAIAAALLVTLLLPLTARAETKWRDPETGMVFVEIPAGCFQMGNEAGGVDEKPVHEVCLDGFWLGKYEVTQGQWQTVMGDNPSAFKMGSDYPVEKVSWIDVQAFFRKLNVHHSGGGFRLPTEAEWEYACRNGGQPIAYPWGNQEPVCQKNSANGANFSLAEQCQNGGTQPVGSYHPNQLGLFDMSGNVYEWVQDRYDQKAYGYHSRINPIYEASGSARVRRGGSWSLDPSHMRCTYRYLHIPAGGLFNLGFRAARDRPLHTTTRIPRRTCPPHLPRGCIRATSGHFRDKTL